MSPMTALSVHEINKKRVEKSKLFHTTTRKKDAVREDFGHLPPEQRRKVCVCGYIYIYMDVCVCMCMYG
jgi:hypothetical protein